MSSVMQLTFAANSSPLVDSGYMLLQCHSHFGRLGHCADTPGVSLQHFFFEWQTAQCCCHDSRKLFTRTDVFAVWINRVDFQRV